MKQISTFFWLGTAALVAVGWVILTDTPMAVETAQTGYRGTGMAVVADVDDLAQARLENTIPEPQTYDIDPLPPEPDEPTISELDYYENVAVLGDLTEANFLRFMAAMTEWVSPEQGCVYCHNEEGDFAAEDNYAKRVSRRMIQMTRDLNTNWQDHVADTGVTCYTCHRGQPVPKYIWFKDRRPRDGMMAGADRAIQNRPSFLTAYSSLPSVAIEEYLTEAASPDTIDRQIRVVPTASRVPGHGAGDIHEAEMTYGLMMYISQSIGANCTYCHNSRAFLNWESSPPRRATAYYGIQMTRYVNTEYLIPLGPAYPPERFGPAGDPPKAACQTCHQGAPLPLGGVSMAATFPELRTQGAPVYE